MGNSKVFMYSILFVVLITIHCYQNPPYTPPDATATETLSIEYDRYYDVYEFEDAIDIYYPLNPEPENLRTAYNVAAGWELKISPTGDLPDPRPDEPDTLDRKLIRYEYPGTHYWLEEYHEENQSESAEFPYHLLSIYGCTNNHPYPQSGWWVNGVSQYYDDNVPPPDPYSYVCTMDAISFAVMNNKSVEEGYQFSMSVAIHELGHSIAGLTEYDINHTNIPYSTCVMRDGLFDSGGWRDPFFCQKDNNDPEHPYCELYLSEVDLLP